MSYKSILILGGYGNAGRLIAKLLLKQTNLNIVIAGRNVERARILADLLNQKFPGKRVSAKRVDAADYQNLQNTFAQVDLVVVASATIDYVENVARAAMAARIDYLDTQLSTPRKIETLRSLEADMIKNGCCFITDGGFHPGLPAALIRHAAQRFDYLEEAKVGSLIRMNWKELSFSESTIREMVQEFKDFRPVIFKNGEWITRSFKDTESFGFGGDFGWQSCTAMFLEELHFLPQTYPSLQETGFYVGGFNRVTDYFIIPFGMGLTKIWPNATQKLFAKLLHWGLKTFSKPPFVTMLLCEANGRKNNKEKTIEIKLYHRDGYFLTAAPVVACLLQVFNEEIGEPGLWFQANIVHTGRFFEDMKTMGIQISIKNNF